MESLKVAKVKDENFVNFGRYDGDDDGLGEVKRILGLLGDNDSGLGGLISDGQTDIDDSRVTFTTEQVSMISKRFSPYNMVNMIEIDDKV